ncbi:hypothetical protein KP79_PYT22650 [Mizuhopecten yessoensis]|uniref:Uncharacterized protein n=1 Tax=Mizuhopecten yessoensis TaxID=6573 RepID=A0A210PIC1_MIZYE|nr:hypothetical protein KP79_PYT22650 [Mizuhopecten yessoensis]
MNRTRNSQAVHRKPKKMGLTMIQTRDSQAQSEGNRTDNDPDQGQSSGQRVKRMKTSKSDAQ